MGFSKGNCSPMSLVLGRYTALWLSPRDRDAQHFQASRTHHLDDYFQERDPCEAASLRPEDRPMCPVTLRDPVIVAHPAPQSMGLLSPPEHLPNLRAVSVFLTLNEEGHWPMGPGSPPSPPSSTQGARTLSLLPEPQGLLRGRHASVADP